MRMILRELLKMVQLLFLIFLLFAYAMFQGGFVSWFLFYSLVPLLVYMITLLFYPLSNFSVTRNIKKSYLEAGDSLQVDIEIKRKYPIPLMYLRIEEIYSDSIHYFDIGKMKYQEMTRAEGYNEKRSMRTLIFPWFKREKIVTYYLNHLPRGKHKRKAMRIQTGELFGFINKEAIIETENELIIYPKIKPIKLLQTARQLDSGNSPSTLVNEKHTNIVSGVREYIPGDRFSWIDWKTTARKNTVMTKEFEQEKDTQLGVVLDLCGGKSENKLAFEGTIDLVASLLSVLQRKHFAASFLSVGESSVYFPPTVLQFQTNQIQSYLASVTLEENDAFVRQFENDYKRFPKGVSLVIIIRRLDEAKQRMFLQLKKIHPHIYVFLLKAKKEVTPADENIKHSLASANIQVRLITERELLRPEIEVKITS